MLIMHVTCGMCNFINQLLSQVKYQWQEASLDSGEFWAAFKSLQRKKK